MFESTFLKNLIDIRKKLTQRKFKIEKKMFVWEYKCLDLTTYLRSADPTQTPVHPGYKKKGCGIVISHVYSVFPENIEHSPHASPELEVRRHKF
jgi:hypothetical protein